MKIEDTLRNKIEEDKKRKQELLDKQQKQNEIVAEAFKREILAKLSTNNFNAEEKLENYTLHFNNLQLPETMNINYYEIPCTEHLFEILNNEFEDCKISSLKIDKYYNNDKCFYNIIIIVWKNSYPKNC